MVEKIDFGTVRDEAELRAHAAIMSWSFNYPEDGLIETFERVGPEKIRVLREAGKPIAGCTVFPMGQWFGGRCLSMAGINLVGVAPEQRGHGAATRLMRAVVRDARDQGFRMTTLFPAKQTLYRRVGYELAGGRYEIFAAVADLATGDRTAVVRQLTPEDEPAVHSLHEWRARRANGALQRPDFMWYRISNPREGAARGYAIEGRQGLDGYFYVRETPGEGMRHDLIVTDLVTKTPEASSRALQFFADHASLAGKLRCFGDPIGFVAAREQLWSVKLFFAWMIRLLDVRNALTERGYGAGIDTEVHFDLRDELCPENAGTFVLEVGDGQAHVRSGGRGELKLDVRGLGPLFAGHMSAWGAATAGLVEGPDDALDRASSVFAGPAPWMSDMF